MQDMIFQRIPCLTTELVSFLTHCFNCVDCYAWLIYTIFSTALCWLKHLGDIQDSSPNRGGILCWDVWWWFHGKVRVKPLENMHMHIYHSGWSDFASFELKCPTLPGGTCPKLWKKMLMMTLQNMMVCIWVLLILFIFICSCICIFIVGYDYYSLIWIIDNSTFNWLNYLSCIAGIVLLLFWN